MFSIIPGPPAPFQRAPFLHLLFVCPVKLILYYTYHILNRLRLPPKLSGNDVRVVCISDTHEQVPSSIPDGDIVIFAGDLTNSGTLSKIQEQINWIASLPHAVKIVVAGNQDTFLDPRTRKTLEEKDRDGVLDWKGVEYLQHSGLSVEILPSQTDRTEPRLVTMYGSPQIPACGPFSTFAFQYPPEDDAWSGTLPPDIDILITHTPPQYHLDITVPAGLGCRYLLKELWKTRPKLHVFGHVHEGYGKEICYWDRVQKAYELGMARTGGWSHGWLDFGLWILILKVLLFTLKILLWERILGGGKPRQPTIMVNAAQMNEWTGKLAKRENVVDI